MIKEKTHSYKNREAGVCLAVYTFATGCQFIIIRYFTFIA